MTSIAAAQQSIKALLGIAKAATGAVVDHEVKSRLIEIQQGILDVQSQLGDAQADRLELMQEVQVLRDKVRDMTAAQYKLDAYKLHELAPGVLVYKSEPGQLRHFACPRCFAGRTVGILQSTELVDIGRIRWNCSVCPFEAYTDSGISAMSLRVSLVPQGLGS